MEETLFSLLVALVGALVIKNPINPIIFLDEFFTNGKELYALIL